MEYFYGMRYPLTTMEDYIKKNWAIDATLGGLIIGRTHDEGGIYFWVKKDGFYVLEGEVEGYEYIINFGATNYYSKITDRFHQHDQHKRDFVDYDPPSHIKLLDTRHNLEPRFLLFDFGGFSIINKYSTKGYLNSIDEMNKAVTFEVIEENSARYRHNDNKEIKVMYYDILEGYIPAPKNS